VVTRPGPLSPSVVLRGIVTPTLRLCPLCVQAHPYVRLLWRLTPVAVCLKHGCVLQAHCWRCGQPLTAIGPSQRLLRCGRCAADVRLLPVVAAAAAVLRRQQRQQADLPFLLDPTTTLVPPPPPAGETPAQHMSRAIGLKFRYLRMQVGLSVAQIAQRMVSTAAAIVALENGRDPVTMPLYLRYLDALSLSWPAFAAVEVPPEFVRRLQEPPYLPLRLCPTPACPNSQPPPGLGVWVLADLPEQRIVRFRCQTCRRAFTRRDDGTLVTKARRPPLRPGESPPVVKSAEEIARLREMGLQGLTNRAIARRLGWGEKTVRMYWIALNLEEQVHVAQAQRQAQAIQRRREGLRARVEAIVAALCAAGELITVQRVGRALGHTDDYLRTEPDVFAYVQEVAQRHNAQMRQQRHELLQARCIAALAEAKRRPDPISLHQIIRPLGLTYSQLKAAYPDLHQRLRQEVETERAARQATRRERHAAQIDAAATRLITDGVRLTYTGCSKQLEWTATTASTTR
jgi:transcriptional regulator with XRE-family HTH domain